jgi:methionine-rich copper-binding protein CopC
MPGVARAIRAVVALVAVGLVLVGPAATAVSAHSQLVTSDPAAGDVVPTAPFQIRLVFSEPISPKATSLDLLDPSGRTLISFAGTPDPADPYTLVAPLPALSDGIYTVNWRALSAADGHATTGSFTFGVGNVSPPPVSGADTTGAIHAGHDAATSFLETESRIVGDIGLLLAAGLPLIGWLVLRSTSIGLARATGVGLLLAAVGAGGLLVLGASSAGIGLADYAGDRNGLLLVARLALSGLGAVVVLALARRRARPALVIGCGAGLAGLVLLAASGHAAAYAAPAPVLAVVVHVIAAAIWFSGVLILAWVATLGGGPRASVAVVPRFSALALVSVGLVAMTGVYSDWLQTRSLLSLATPYEATLAAKIVLALAAFSVGAINYLGLERFAFRTRILVESALALSVVVATGILASGSPPGQEQPIAIAPATSSAISNEPPSALALAPGRPGPTRFLATVAAPLVSGQTVELALTRLDQPSTSQIPMRAVPGASAEYAASGGLLPANSSWDATVIIRGAHRVELGRTRFTFAMDAATVSEGRATPPVDPVVIIALILLVGAVVAGVFAIAGGAPPRVDRRLGRAAVVAASGVAAVLGIVLLVGGPTL